MSSNESATYRRGLYIKNVGTQKPARYRQVNDKPAVTYSGQSIMLQLPSALVGLTSVVGMGTGVSPPLEPPTIEDTLYRLSSTRRGLSLLFNIQSIHTFTANDISSLAKK